MRFRIILLVAAVAAAIASAAPSSADRYLASHSGQDRHRCPDIKASPGTPADFPRGTFDTRKLLERRVRSARKVARRFGCSISVIKRDGVFAPADSNIVSYVRVNVAVSDGRISRIFGVG